MLLVGTAVIVAALAAVAGLVARHRPRPGLMVIAGLGVIGLLAVVTAPVFTPVDLLAPAAATGVGLGVFGWLHRLARPADRDTGTGRAGRRAARRPGR